MKAEKKKIILKTIWADDVCLLVEQEVPVSETHTAASPGAWLNIFCPQGSCEISSASQLP